jgi:cysteinyl-tRNA synthetase
MNFTFDLLAQAKANVERIQGRYDRLVEVAGEGPVSPEVEALIARNAHAFDEALEDNLNMSNALAAVFAFITELNQRTLSPGDARAGLAALEGMDGVLAVIDRTSRSGVLSKADLEQRASAQLPPIASLLEGEGPLDVARIEALVVHRFAAKKAKDFATADRVRKDLDQRGVILEDVAAGARWRLK